MSVITEKFAAVEAAIAEMTGELPKWELDSYRAEFEHTGAREAMRYAMEKSDSTVMPRRMRQWDHLASVAEEYADVAGE